MDGSNTDAFHLAANTVVQLSLELVDTAAPNAETEKQTIASAVRTVPTQTAVKTSNSNLSIGSGMKPVLQEPQAEDSIAPSSLVAIHEFLLRGDDHVMSSCLSLFEVRRNERKIHRALLKMAEDRGMLPGDDTWQVSVGYDKLCKATGCSARTLGRAWPQLLGWGFLDKITEHHNRDCKVYAVRSIESVDAKYKENGYTYFRVMPDRSLLPFRPKPISEKGAL